MGRKKKEICLKEPVRIREKKIAGGNISLYLDIYQKGLRKKETLKLYRRSGSERMDGGSRNNQAYNLPLLTTYGGYDAPDPWCKYLCSKQDTRTQEHQDDGDLRQDC